VRIAEFCPYDIDRPGGVQRHICDLAIEFQRLGHEVVIIAPGHGSPGRMAVRDGIPVLRVGASRRIGFAGTAFEVSFALGAEHRRLADMMRDAGFDVVHFHTIWTPILALQAFRLSRAANVVTCHDTSPETLGGKMTTLALRNFARWLLPRLDGVVAVSTAAAGHLPRRAAVQTPIVPPCIDLQPFMVGAAAFAAQRDGKLNILYLGRLEPRKAVMSLLRAYRDLAAEIANLRLLIAGDGPERPALEAFVAQRHLPNVVFLGRVTDDEKPRWYATADIVCAPSAYGESFGIVIAEAMASGRPVVAAANAGYRDLVTGPGAEFLFTPGDDAALTRHLARLGGDPDLRARLGAWGRRHAAQYDCANVAPRLLAIFEAARSRARDAAPRRLARTAI
jgi:phosphatidylinositol alpha-mannosyltransferase